MKWILLFIASVITIIFVLFLLLIIPFPNFDTKKINCESIESIKPGDSLSKVIRILGNPIEYHIYSVRSHEFACKEPNNGIGPKKFQNNEMLLFEIYKIKNDTTHCCSGAKNKLFNLELTYTKSMSIFCHPMLWIHLDKNAKVYSVYAKEYTLLDDIGIYGYSCEWDDINKENLYTKVEKHCMEGLFKDCFD